MATSSKTSDQYDDKKSSVVRDLIWKDHVSKIETAQKFYDKRWGFLNDSQLQPSFHDLKHIPANLHSSIPTPSTIHGRHYTERSVKDASVIPSPRPIPATTNQLIGWRTADKNCALEKYGKYARGQESLHKKFKWPVEGFD